MNRYVKEAIKEMELMLLCDEICDDKNAMAIYHALWRRDVRSIDDLKRLDLNRAVRFPCIGEMRLEFIKELQIVVEDEERTKRILEKSVALSMIKNDESLYEKIYDLWDWGRCSEKKIAKILNINEDIIHFILRW